MNPWLQALSPDMAALEMKIPTHETLERNTQIIALSMGKCMRLESARAIGLLQPEDLSS